MISYLSGKIVSKEDDKVVIDIGGVGFCINMPANMYAALPPCGQNATVYTYMQVREDDISLYGFVDISECELFEKLISVSGIGPKVAMTSLGSIGKKALLNAITSEDVAAVSKVPGIGKKTAQRIILELKGVLATTEDVSSTTQTETENIKIAREALLSMGFSKNEVNKALKGANSDETDAKIIQYALKRLG